MNILAYTSFANSRSWVASVSVLALGNDGPVQVLRINDTGPIQLPEKSEGKSHDGKGRQAADNTIDEEIEPVKSSASDITNAANPSDRHVKEEE